MNRSLAFVFGTLLALSFAPLVDAQQAPGVPAAAPTAQQQQIKQDNKNIRQDKRAIRKDRRNKRQTRRSEKAASGGGR
jgi:hypothetical protein